MNLLSKPVTEPFHEINLAVLDQLVIRFSYIVKVTL